MCIIFKNKMTHIFMPLQINKAINTKYKEQHLLNLVNAVLIFIQ